MSDDELALLRGAAINPDDDLPRLVYADWLDDHARHDQAAFVRLQVRRASLDFHDPDRVTLLEEERISLQLSQRKWNGSLHRWLHANGLRGNVDRRRGVIRGWDYLRGMPSRLAVSGHLSERALAAAFSLGPISTLQVFRWEGWVEGERTYPHSLRIVRLIEGVLGELRVPDRVVNSLVAVPILDVRTTHTGIHAPRLAGLARQKRISPVILFRSWVQGVGNGIRVIDPFGKWPGLRLRFADLTGELLDPLPYQSATR